MLCAAQVNFIGFFIYAIACSRSSNIEIPLLWRLINTLALLLFAISTSSRFSLGSVPVFKLEQTLSPLRKLASPKPRLKKFRRLAFAEIIASTLSILGKNKK